MSDSIRPVYGPTYAEMRDPGLLEPAFRARAAELQTRSPLHRDNLFNIHWQDAGTGVSAFLVPPSVSGLKANLIVMDGGTFPSGSMKVGPAYAMLMERELKEGIRPGSATVIAPSTGNFGIGSAWVARVKGYEARVVMPSGMSRERYALIERYGATTDLTPGSEADVNLTLQRTQERYAGRSDCVVLGQFSDLANYRFHRHVTAEGVRRAVQGLGLDGVDLFVSAPGSAGTLAAGEGLRESFPNLCIAAVEPEECATLTDGGHGSHVIEGIGDQMVTLIHNVHATDLVVRIPGELTIRGTAVFSGSRGALMDVFGIDAECAAGLQGRFGPSGICNLAGAMQAATYLGLGQGHTVVTVATDSNDRYRSVLEQLADNLGRQPGRKELSDRWSRVRGLEPARQVLDVREGGHQARLHGMKRDTWMPYGYSADFIDSMQAQAFWDREYALVEQLDRRWRQVRQSPGTDV